MNRRDFLLRTTVASSALTLSAAGQSMAEPAPGLAAQRLRILILGGTGFIGPHFVRVALDRGHHVAVFNRGRKTATGFFNSGKVAADLPSGVELLLGDRNGQLESIKNRDWDAVLDLSVYTPSWVRSLGEALRGRVRHYTFISSIDVYDYTDPANRCERMDSINEQSKLVENKGEFDPYSVIEPDKLTNAEFGARYSLGKLSSEREAQQQFPGKTLIVRPGTLIGPRDNTERLTYWAVRIEKGGDILAPGDPGDPHQNLDVGDLAQWVLGMAERNEVGIYNGVGPDRTIAEVLGGMTGALSTTARLIWVPSAWLMQEKQKGTELHLPLWFAPADRPTFMRVSGAKARAKGLSYRPLALSTTDILKWYHAQPSDQQRGMITYGRNKAQGSEPERPITPWEILIKNETEVLARWRRDAVTVSNAPACARESTG